MSEYRDIECVAMVGAGVMGSKVAWACCVAGLSVRLYDPSRPQMERALKKIECWMREDGCAEAEIADALSHVTLHDSLGAAVDGVDLAFENVPERLDLKNSVHRQIHELVPEDVLLGSNASSIVVSDLADASGRPELFFNMNFADPREGPLVEIMVGPKTSTKTLKSAELWARKLNMIPIITRKEIIGYCFNRIWRAIKKESLFLADQGYADFEDIDRAFMLSFGVPQGPFAIMDEVGLNSVKLVEEQYYQASGDASDRPPKILNDLVDEGHLGVQSGKGFYDYPNPAYSRPGWLAKQED